MIENERQYSISQKIVADFQEAIDRINNNPNKDPLRKELLTGSLIMAKEEIEQEIATYELQKGIKAHD